MTLLEFYNNETYINGGMVHILKRKWQKINDWNANEYAFDFYTIITLEAVWFKQLLRSMV